MGRTKARRTLQAECSVEGIKRLADQIRQYSIDIEQANNKFVRRLAEEGFDIARIAVYNGLDPETWNGRLIYPYDVDKDVGVFAIENDDSGEIDGVCLSFTGSQVLFIEFGSGWYWNGAVNPKAKKFGYGVGTYPGQKHAFDENGWSYQGEDGKWRKSMGTQATMPMYKASVAIREKLVAIAKEVYQSVI